MRRCIPTTAREGREHGRHASLPARWPAIEYRVRQADGGFRWASREPRRSATEEGAIAEWVGTVTDIQEQKDSEQALREREELLTLAVEATGLGIWDMELPSRRPNGRPAQSDGRAAARARSTTSLLRPRPSRGYGAVEEKITEAVGDAEPRPLQHRLSRLPRRHRRGALVARMEPPGHGPQRASPRASSAPSRTSPSASSAEIERHNSEKRWRLALKAGRMVAWEQTLDSGMITAPTMPRSCFGIGTGRFDDFLERVHPVDRPALPDARQERARSTSIRDGISLPPSRRARTVARDERHAIEGEADHAASSASRPTSPSARPRRSGCGTRRAMTP